MFNRFEISMKYINIFYSYSTFYIDIKRIKNNYSTIFLQNFHTESRNFRTFFLSFDIKRRYNKKKK